MKRYYLLACVILLVMLAKAQSPLFFEGDKRINLGLGLNKYPVSSITVDYGVVDGIFDYGAIGIGPYISFGYKDYDAYWGLGARGTFHYPIIDDVDTYIGLGVGLRYEVKQLYKNKLSGIPGIFLGANYPISKMIDVFGEVGSGVSYLTVGFSILIE